MKLVQDLVLDVLIFLDYASRFRMLSVSRRMHAIVDKNRRSLALPEVGFEARTLLGWLFLPTLLSFLDRLIHLPRKF